MSTPPPDGFEAGFAERNPRTLARVISAIEDPEGPGDEFWKWLYQQPAEGLAVAVTGAPGVGKSSLINRIIAHFRERGHTVAVLSVDPSSPLSGGAILGDRIRMIAHSTDPGVFIRSLAARWNKGGLTAATPQVLAAVRAFGFDIVLLETVGVGQNEVDARLIADVTCLVLSPGQGDDIQALKAGIMEVADLYVINKSDQPGTEKLLQELETAQDIGGGELRQPILKTRGDTGDGVPELVEAIQTLAKNRTATEMAGRRMRLREFAIRSHLRMMLEREVQRLAIQDDGLATPYQAARMLFAQATGKRPIPSQPAVTQIDHLGVAIEAMPAARKVFEELIGLPVLNEEYVEKDKVETVTFGAGETNIELLASPEGVIAKYLAKKGPGIHHMCLRVNDITGMLAKLASLGVELVDKEPRHGAHGRLVAFLHPKSTAGILVELAQVGEE